MIKRTLRTCTEYLTQGVGALTSLLFPPRKSDKRWSEITEQDIADRITRTQHPMHTWIYSTHRYRDPYIQELLWAGKFHGRQKAFATFAPSLTKLAEVIPEEALLVPIPLSKERLQERGFNQSDLLANMLAAFRPDLTVVHALQKIKNTKPQSGLKRAERLENCKGVFRVTDQSVIAGKEVVLVDDIVTTGATLCEAKRVLEEAGMKSVKAVVVAR